MEFGLSFTYVFKDPDWVKKILLIAVITLIPVIGQLVAFGFALEIMKRVINHDPTPLPELDFGGFLGKGFQAFIISFVYSLPIIILVAPTQIVALFGESMDADVAMYLTAGVGCICGGLGLIYGILMAFMLPAAYGEFLSSGSLGAAFKIGKIFGLVRKAPVAFLLAILATFIGGIIAPLGSIACVIGVFATMAYYFAIMGHIYGQAYNQAVQAA